MLNWPMPRRQGIPQSHCATASVGSSRRPSATANNWPACTLAPKALGASCRAFTMVGGGGGGGGGAGYIFVVLDPERDRWRSINGTFGVARLVSAHQRPTPVPTGVVEAMLANIDELGLVRFDGDLKPGQLVHVVAGPFAQVLGVLQRLDAKGRVQVLLNIMGRQAAVITDQAHLTAA